MRGNISSTDRKAIGCKWVIRLKFKVDASLKSYKVKLMAKEYTQQSSVDFVDTYLSVVKFTFIRIIISIITKMNWNYIN